VNLQLAVGFGLKVKEGRYAQPENPAINEGLRGFYRWISNYEVGRNRKEARQGRGVAGGGLDKVRGGEQILLTGTAPVKKKRRTVLQSYHHCYRYGLQGGGVRGLHDYQDP